jgi:hypothetical protein
MAEEVRKRVYSFAHLFLPNDAFSSPVFSRIFQPHFTYAKEYTLLHGLTGLRAQGRGIHSEREK